MTLLTFLRLKNPVVNFLNFLSSGVLLLLQNQFLIKKNVYSKNGRFAVVLDKSTKKSMPLFAPITLNIISVAMQDFVWKMRLRAALLL